MESKINYAVFINDESVIDDSEINKIVIWTSKVEEEYRRLACDLLMNKYFKIMDGKYSQGDLDVSLFLDEDMTINLDKLELGVIVAHKILMANSENLDLNLGIFGLDRYIEQRGIKGNEKQIAEETKFIQKFISAVLDANFHEQVYKFLFKENIT